MCLFFFLKRCDVCWEALGLTGIHASVALPQRSEAFPRAATLEGLRVQPSAHLGPGHEPVPPRMLRAAPQRRHQTLVEQGERP